MFKFLNDYTGPEVVSIASELTNAKLPTNSQVNNMNFVSLFDSVDPFSDVNRAAAAGKFYGTWCSLYRALVKGKLIDLSILQATHMNISNANDTLSRLQGSAKVIVLNQLFSANVFFRKVMRCCSSHNSCCHW